MLHGWPWLRRVVVGGRGGGGSERQRGGGQWERVRERERGRGRQIRRKDREGKEEEAEPSLGSAVACLGHSVYRIYAQCTRLGTLLQFRTVLWQEDYKSWRINHRKTSPVMPTCKGCESPLTTCKAVTYIQLVLNRRLPVVCARKKSQGKWIYIQRTLQFYRKKRKKKGQVLQEIHAYPNLQSLPCPFILSGHNR